MSDPHELLPWYLNSTLDDAERSAFEDHLAACASCRQERAIIDDLRQELRNPDWDLMSEHPSPEALAEVFLDGKEGAQTRRHVALCLTCAQEVRWLKGETAAGTTGSRSRVSARLGWVALAAAAMLVVAVAAGLIARSPEAGHGTGLLPLALIPPSQRAGAEAPVVQMSARAADVHLLFEIDLPPEGFPAAFQVIDASGRVVFGASGLRAADLYRGSFLLFACSRADCPDGSYVARLRSATAGAPDVEYPFRIASSR